ncbi:hypothetical protein DXA66_02730 [Faecalibacterium sp. OF03-6AC]|nr:hypothetical protein DXA66_02730 [Faecalibacterium sp. OF03-6AC]
MRGTIRNGLRAALAMFRGKIILNFGVQESLRTFLNPIFTGGVAEESSIYYGYGQSISGERFNRFPPAAA